MAERHGAALEISGGVPSPRIDPQQFLCLRFDDEDRACWTLYRHIVGTVAGVWLPEHEGVEDRWSIARVMRGESISERWHPIEPGQERPLDLVLMRGQAGKGREARLVPMHVGCVVRPGLMLDVEKGSGIMLRAYRETKTITAHPKVKVRFIGIYRPEALA